MLIRGLYKESIMIFTSETSDYRGPIIEMSSNRTISRESMVLSYCIIFSFSLALLYRLTRCVAAMVVLHAWGNVVLGGMFTYHSLTSLPGLKTCLLYLVEIVISCIAAMAVSRRNNCA